MCARYMHDESVCRPRGSQRQAVQIAIHDMHSLTRYIQVLNSMANFTTYSVLEDCRYFWEYRSGQLNPAFKIILNKIRTPTTPFGFEYFNVEPRKGDPA